MMQKQRFPFIIIPYKLKKKSSDENFFDQLANIVEQNNDIRDKIIKLLAKTGFLESSLNEFLEKNQNKDIGIFFNKLMPILDNLESLRHAVEISGEDEWKRGIGFFYEKLINLFSQYNLRLLAARGIQFDPSQHEAVDAVKDSGLSSGTIIDIIENGWRYDNKILKFAKVVVAK